MDSGASYMFSCPRCGLDTPHSIVDRRKDVLGVVCGHCRMPSIVQSDVFRNHQNMWEEELRQILNSLDTHGEDDR